MNLFSVNLQNSLLTAISLMITLPDPGGHPQCVPPQQDPILLFWHMFLPKNIRVRGRHPPTGKSWIRHWISHASTLLANFNTLHSYQTHYNEYRTYAMTSTKVLRNITSLYFDRISILSAAKLLNLGNKVCFLQDTKADVCGFFINEWCNLCFMLSEIA